MNIRDVLGGEGFLQALYLVLVAPMSCILTVSVLSGGRCLEWFHVLWGLLVIMSYVPQVVGKHMDPSRCSTDGRPGVY